MAVVLGLFLIPGPAVLLVASRTIQGGRKAGVVAGLGIATGDLIHTSLAAVGLSAVLMTSALAFSLVKYAGAAYLLYLGISALLEKPADPQLPRVSPVTMRRSFRQAVVIEVLNPKTALFFLSFLPQFVHPEYGPVLSQLAILGLIFVGMSAVYTTMLAISIRMLGRLFERFSWLGRWSGKAAGAIYIGLGLRVAAQTR